MYSVRMHVYELTIYMHDVLVGILYMNLKINCLCIHHKQASKKVAEESKKAHAGNVRYGNFLKLNAKIHKSPQHANTFRPKFVKPDMRKAKQEQFK